MPVDNKITANDTLLFNLYLEKIEKIPVASFNREQKEIAKLIIKNTPKEDLDKVYNLITQRVKTGFVFDCAPEVSHNCVALIEENKDLFIKGDSFALAENVATEHALIIGENYDALKNLCATYIRRKRQWLDRCNLYRPAL
jgi:adenine-specific DNA-methyltransferase